MTVSVSGWGSAAVLSSLVAALGDSQPDFYSFHFYASDPALAFAAFQQAKQAAAPLPLFIGETGYSTYAQNTSAPGVPGTRGAHESYQDLFLRTVEQAALQAGLPPAAPWGLYDFMAAAQPNLVERYFGLYRADGTPKPAAASVASILAGNPVNLSYDAGMETYAGGFPGGWRLLDPFSATFALDTTVAYSGASSARISGSGTPDAWGPAYVTSPPSTVVPGGRYYLQVYARGAAATGTSRATVYWFDGTGGNLGSALMTRSLPNGTTGWTSLAGYGQAPAGSVYVRIALSSQGNSGTTWFDQVTFVPVA